MSLWKEPATGQRRMRRPRRPLLLLAGLLAAGFVALSVHVVMLYSGVPFPIPQAPLWARWLNLTLIVGGTLLFLWYAAPRLAHLGTPGRTLVTFVTLATIQETLRNAIMTAVVTGGLLQPSIALLGPIVRTLATALICVVAARRVKGRLSIVIVAPIAAAVALGASLAINWALSPVLQYGARFAQPDLYQAPYPFHVTLAAYITFVEAIVGATLMTAMVWGQLPGSKMARLLTLAVLAALLKGVVGGTFIYGFFTGPSVLIGMFSWSQFLLEFLVLGFLIGVAWEMFGQPAPPRPDRKPRIQGDER